MNRREFIQRSTALAGAAYLGTPALADSLMTLGDPNLIIGIVSDIHIRGTETAVTFKHTLEYFRQQKVDGVIIAGDMADQGLEPQLKVVADTWYSVFPNDEGLDGKHTEKLFIYGNHDMEAYTWGSVTGSVGSETANAQGIGRHPAEVWKTHFKEDYTPIWFKTIKGYHFIGAHWHTNNIPGLETLMQQHAQELETEKPFFYIQHPHLKNTCNGPWAWGQDDGTVTRIMEKYPNAVAFSGHSHSPLTDERDLWQGKFTSIGTASLQYLYPMPARENTYQDDSNLKPVYQMPNMDCSQGRQGMVMRVYDNCLTFERREFVYDQNVGDSWMLPWPISQSQPLTYENRGKVAPIPQFQPGDSVSLTQAQGKDRNGNSTEQVTVHFPNVLKKQGGVRAFDFEVQVEWEWLDCRFISATKRVFSPKSLFGEAQDEGEVTCVFSTGELPKDRSFRFIVRPCECFGGKGEPICSEWVRDGKIPTSMTSSLSLAKQFYKTGEEISVQFKDAPVGTDAWVGIYVHDKNPGSDSPSYAYQYTKVKDGTLTFKVSASEEYYAVLFKDGGYSECSVRVPFFVLTRDFDPAAFVMKTNKLAYNVGDPVRVSLTKAPYIAKDWVGIYSEGLVPADEKCPTWQYLSAVTGTISLNTSGSRNWTSALAAGYYFVGYFCSDGYTEPFPRKFFAIGKPAKLNTDTTSITTKDNTTVHFSGLSANLQCQLCHQAENETVWTPLHSLSGKEGTLSLGTLDQGTHKYAICLDGTPISTTLTLQVKMDQEDSVGAVTETNSPSAPVFRLDGSKAGTSLSSLRSGLYIVGGTKVLK